MSISDVCTGWVSRGCHVEGPVTLGVLMSAPACRRIVDKRIDACYSAVGARQDEQLLWKQMRTCLKSSCNDDDGNGRWLGLALRHKSETSATYHRPRMDCCCIRAGETDGGGLDIVMPVRGLMIGMALRARVADGWWSFKDW